VLAIQDLLNKLTRVRTRNASSKNRADYNAIIKAKFKEKLHVKMWFYFFDNWMIEKELYIG
jgi:predicted subunit of tRNA(5-methylaminomethyl-2-thiouridylate) methyltransferase